jgi:hypothetical protein
MGLSDDSAACCEVPDIPALPHRNQNNVRVQQSTGIAAEDRNHRNPSSVKYP